MPLAMKLCAPGTSMSYVGSVPSSTNETGAAQSIGAAAGGHALEGGRDGVEDGHAVVRRELLGVDPAAMREDRMLRRAADAETVREREAAHPTHAARRHGAGAVRAVLGQHQIAVADGRDRP